MGIEDFNESIWGMIIMEVPMSIKYYDDNIHEYINETVDADMEFLYEIFESHLSGKNILDLGCGTGRDSLYFFNKGFTVTSVDGSKSMIEHCKKHLKNKVILSTFEDYETDDKYDGIWANASLLHVKRDQLHTTIQCYIRMLNSEGIFYISFKERDEDIIGERHFTCFNKESLLELVDELDCVGLIDMIHTNDSRDYREDEKWISIILKKCN